MTDSMSGPNGHRWLCKAIPAGMAVLLAAGVTAGPALAATPAPSPAGLTTSLVAPTGHYRAGTVRLHLVDPTRTDPTSPTHGFRELMVQVWYPALGTRGFPATPYLTPLAATHFLAGNNLPPGTTLPQTTGHVSAPTDRRHGPYPVVLYSPGGGADGSLDTGLVERPGRPRLHRGHDGRHERVPGGGVPGRPASDRHLHAGHGREVPAGAADPRG
jgi:hypothetical protein